METAMTPENASRLDMLSRQLNENLMSAAFCVKEIGEIARSELDGNGHAERGANGAGQRRGEPNPMQRPLLDESTLSAIWKGKPLHLGHTRGFWLLARLAGRPNQYVTHLDLLREVWDDEFKDTTVLRSVVWRLRVKLQEGGMGDLASAIIGHHGRYMLDLSNVPHHRDVTAMPHRMSQG